MEPSTPKEPRTRRAVKREALFTFGAALGLAGLLVGGYLWLWPGSGGDAGAPGAARGERAARAVPVVVAEIEYSDFVDRIEALGTAGANESVTLTAKVSDQVSAIHFTDGMLVEAGDVLVELASDENAAQLAQARASLDEAEKAYRRILDLEQRGTSTRAQLDSALARRNVAQAQVEAIEARLADRIVRAPFSGVLGLRMVSLGTLMRPGDVITTLDDISRIKVDFSLPEKFLTAVEPGQLIEAKAAAYAGETFRGEVTAVDTRVDPVTRAATVRAEIPNEDRRLKPGMLMMLEVLSNQRRSMTLPEVAVYPVADQNYVWVVENGRAKRRAVETGGRRPGLVEILAGVAEGEKVIVEGVNRVQENRAVEILNAAEDSAEKTAGLGSEGAALTP
ncbi:MAG: efflux RND transporter periplasmic adaptor subunit [Alphaproteobacteria bacterium]|nr:efflux RND transporter periplasmic adaptor subunit [Alphaproteobacteria bacterium]